MNEKFCSACERLVYLPDNDLCEFCAEFDGTCPICDEDVPSIVEHTCKKCGGMECDHDCPSAILEIRDTPVLLNIKIAYHETGSNTWYIYDTLSEAIREWEFGASRCGAHHWDSKMCHIYHDKKNDKYHLLYM